MKNSWYILLIILAAGVSACNWNKPDKVKNQINSDTLVYKVVKYVKQGASCTAKADSDCKVTAEYEYISFPGQAALSDTVKSRLLHIYNNPDKKFNSIEEQAADFVKDFDTVKHENPDIYFSIDNYAKVLRQDSSLTTIEYGGTSYAGGAHPSSYTGFINWNTKAKKNIELNDLISKANQPKLTAVAEHIFRKSEKLSDTASLANNYFFKDDKFALNNTFLITPVGLSFYYNEYEIKPYAAGPTELVIPYSQIKSLLLPNTVVAQFIHK